MRRRCMAAHSGNGHACAPCLGGTAVDAAQESSSGHGLYRFKTGFGVSPVVRWGVQWVLRPNHLRLHRMLAQLRHPRDL
jgi:hypothetical protein